MSSDMAGPARKDRTLVIGIDFGTTYSGLAYGITDMPDRIVQCQDWPLNKTNMDGASGEKVPTTIRYLPKRGEFEWGFQIPEATAHPDEIMRWFKLGLQNLQNQPDDVRNMLASHDTDRLVRDYLSGLGQYIIYFLRRKLSSHMMDTFIERSAIQFVLTVPAVWEDLAKRKTLQAFENARNIAGLGGVTLVSEPEAAATYALHNMAQESSMEVGQSFIVLDAGGGTVDIITYTITALHPVLQVREAAAGTGDFCGGAMVDKAFAAHLQATLGNEDDFDNEILGRARQEFEFYVKRQFSQSSMPNGSYTVPVPGMANNRELGIRNGRLTLRASEIYAMFEPYILKIIRLVKDQIRTAKVPISAVVLVGGFGSSIYLQERLQKDIAEDMEVPIRLAKNQSLAVVHGAVMKGIAHVAPERRTFLKVVDRAARSICYYHPEHYGTELAVVYDEERHRELEHTRSWDGMDGCWRVETMEWFIRHGDRVAESKPYYHVFQQVSRVSFGRPEIVTLTVFSDSKSDEAPLARNQNVEVLCHVEANLTSIPTTRLPVRRGKDGHDYYVLNCEIEVVYRSASTDYTLIHDTVRYKTVSAEYV